MPHRIFFELNFVSCSRIALIAFFAMAAVVAHPASALAACSNPAGAEGEMIYNDDFNVMQFCNGPSWVSMSGGASAGAESDPQVGATTLNKWCRGDGSSVVCDLDAPSVTETDPEVGTLTASKWCTTNGTEVQCTSDLPIGTLTNGKWCTTDGATVSCTSDAPTTTAGADTQVIFNDAGVLAGDTSFVWDKTNNRLGIGTTTPKEKLSLYSAGPSIRVGTPGTGTFDQVSVNLITAEDQSRFLGQAGVTGWSMFARGNAYSATTQQNDFGISYWNGTAWNSAFSVDSITGAVGIGTASSDAQLEVQKSAAGAGIVTMLKLDPNSTTLGDGAAIRFITSSDNTSGLQIAGVRDATGAYGSLRFSTRNASGEGERLRIDQDGNVGIGTTSPAAKLSLGNDISNTKIMLYDDGTYKYGIGVQANDFRLHTASTNDDFSFRPGPAATSVMIIKGSGNVGIGTAGPYSRLASTNANTVGGDGYGTSGEGISWVVPTTGVGNGYAASIFNEKSAVSDGGLAIKVAGTTATALDVSQNSGQGVQGTALFSVKGNGNVGIGTTSPVAPLHIKGAEAGIFLEETTGGANNEAYLVHYNNAFAIQNRTSTGGSPVVPYSFDIRAPAVTIVTSSSGNVGVGVANPTYKLQASGQVAGAGAYVNTSDARLKKDVNDLDYGLDAVMRLRPVSFHWKDQSEAWQKGRKLGLIAQESELVVPEVVTTANDDMGTKSIAYGDLTPVLIKAVQELKAANDNLFDENVTLRDALDELRDRIDRLEQAK